MSTRHALALALIALGACGGSPAADARGTASQPLTVSMRVQDLGRELSAGLQPWGGMPVVIKESSNSADVTWRTEVVVGAGQTLTVVPASGEPVVFAGQPLRADFYHVGRLLLVTEGEGAALVLNNFLEPVRWYTTPRR